MFLDLIIGKQKEQVDFVDPYGNTRSVSVDPDTAREVRESALSGNSVSVQPKGGGDSLLDLVGGFFR